MRLATEAGPRPRREDQDHGPQFATDKARNFICQPSCWVNLEGSSSCHSTKTPGVGWSLTIKCGSHLP